jgi:asparagine synthase (glutamine-hydrolysing)
MVYINIEENYFWSRYFKGSVVVFIKGYIYSHTVSNILDCIKNLEIENISNFISSLDGHFAIVVQKEKFTFIAVDKIRSTPLFFVSIGDNFYIDYKPERLVEKNGFKEDLIDSAIIELAMSGYVIGNKTVYRNLNSLKAGELVVFRDSNVMYIQYYKYCGSIECKDYVNYIEELSRLTLNIFRKMLKQIGDRQIIIPLSAGNDSRLVASVLKHLGAKNVKCYSYGSKGSFEAKIAQVIAKKLGYDFIFLPLGYKSERKYFVSRDYNEYLKFSETYCSIPYTQSLSTIKYLRDIGWINNNAVFVNGNSGDFISGGHINSLLKGIGANSSKKNRKENILNSLIDKHFSLWGYLKTKRNIERVKTALWNEITLACEDNLQDKVEDHLLYEYSEFIDRQSKFVVSGQRAYEFYGYDWRLPLWDDEYLFFWQKVPAEFKKNQRLYVDMLKKKNFGNVWGDDIPVNKKNISPKWVVPIRFLIKVFLSLFGSYGKTIWKQFDKVVFNYWTVNTHTLKAFSYLSILSDFNKKPRGNYACWSSDNYVKKFKFKL